MTSFTAAIHKEENMYVASCPETNTISQGKTIEEAIKNLKEATKLYSEELSSSLKRGLKDAANGRLRER